MRVTEREAAAIYAKASLKWYGATKAEAVAHSMASKLGKAGDLKGVRAWRMVAEELVRIKQDMRLRPAGDDDSRTPGARRASL
jgi:hypothetical protein